MIKIGKSILCEAIFEWQHGPGRSKKDSSRLGFLRRSIRDEQGQTLVWVAMGMVLFLSASAFALDLGHAYLVRKQLQASADAAALPAAWHLSDGNDANGIPIYKDVALEYGSTGTLNNYNQGYTVDPPVVTARCSTTVKAWGLACDASGANPTYNMVIVTEVAHVPTFFAGVMGFSSLTVSATSAASKGARPTPFNIAVVMDLTASMSFTDNNCSKQTQLKCAEGALKTLLKGLDPTQDYVALFTFPALKKGTETKETSCSSSGSATTEPYVFPSTSGSTVETPTIGTDTATYEMAGFTNTYISSYGASSLNTSNAIVIADGQGSCTGMVADAGTHYTYFASSIYQAHEALLAEQASRLSGGVKSSNAMIILSDGNASAVNPVNADTTVTGFSGQTFKDMACSTTSSTCPSSTVTNGVKNTADGAYPNLYGECNQAVSAAQSFNDPTTGDTLVFSVAYGSSTASTARNGGLGEGDCDSDRAAYGYTGKNQNITPCLTMTKMASSTDDFYADGNSVSSGCTSSNSSTSLTSIATAILGKLTETRLIPPDTP